MGSIISMFKWLWRGLTEMFSWLTSIPAIIVGSIVGVVTSTTSLISSLRGDSFSVVNTAVSVATGPVNSISQYLEQFPDTFKLALYALSLDVLFRFVSAAFFLFVSGVVLVLEFQLVTILSFYAAVYGYKMIAWFINAFFPASWRISGVKSIAGASAPVIDIKV